MTGLWLARVDSGDRLAIETRSDLSVVCLAIILIGLIVIWTGYLKRVRWTWAVMFIVVWVWAFPLLVDADSSGTRVAVSHHLSGSTRRSILSRIRARLGDRLVLLFLLMVIALFLPSKNSLFLTGDCTFAIFARFICIVRRLIWHAYLLIYACDWPAWSLRLQLLHLPPNSPSLTQLSSDTTSSPIPCRAQ